MWGIWGSCYNIPKAIFYLVMGDYNPGRGPITDYCPFKDEMVFLCKDEMVFLCF